MRKKFFISFFICLFASVLFAESMYYYADGFSSAECKGTTAKVRAYNLWKKQQQIAEANLYKVEKLTELERKFLWGALNQYDYRSGEVYFILISASAFQQTFIYAEVQKDKSITWYGWRGYW